MILSKTICISSFIQQMPGVFCQHAKHPLHDDIFIEAMCSSSTVTVSPDSSRSDRTPSIKLVAKRSELLLCPFGLPLISSIFTLHLLQFANAFLAPLLNHFLVH